MRILDKINKGLRSPLARKQLLAILIFSSLITLIDTSIQLYIEFKGDVRFVDAQLSQIGEGHTKSLTSSLWKLDEEQIAIQLNNALSLRDIIYLEIRENGKATFRAGVPASNRMFKSKTFGMVYNNGYMIKKIGTLYVEADLKGSYDRLWKRIAVILTAQGIKTFFVSFFILFIVYNMITRHLITLAGYMQQVNIESFDTALALTRKKRKNAVPDELDEVVSTINNLRNAVNYYIEQQERVEGELRRSERRFRTFAEQAVIGICIVRDGKIVFTNEGLSKILGYSGREFLGFEGRKILELFHPEDGALAGDLCRKNLNGIGDSVEIRVLTRKKEEKWVQLFSKPVMDDEGMTIYGIIVDTTQRRRYEMEMTKFKTITDKANYGATITDPSGHIIYVNECFCLMHGYDAREILGKNISMVVPEAEKPQMDKLNAILHEKGEYSAELVTHIKKDGVEFPTLMNENLIRDAQDRPLYHSGTTLDITELRQLEEQLKHAHKMEAIGTLAGGIAHDFNNILGIILGNAELAIQWIPEASPAWTNLSEIVTASNRAKSVVRQLLNFSRKSDEKKEPSQISHVVKETVNLIRATIPKNIDIRYSQEEDLPWALADTTQIHQIIINLCTNASHSMEKAGGVLDISLTHYQANGKPFDGYHNLKPGSYLCLSVRDTGEGIPRHLLDKIFVPYFTTKETGKGTGMGLAVVHGLVKNHGGEIILKSEIGKGTRVKVFLPALDSSPRKTKSVMPDLPKGTERILFVDDEKALVDIVREILERFGYRVEAFDAPVKAIDRFRQDPEGFDMVITDMAMPQMTGDQLIRQILEIRPGMPIVLCTGFNDDITEDRARAMGLRAVLNKPVNMRDFLVEVRYVLDRVALSA